MSYTANQSLVPFVAPPAKWVGRAVPIGDYNEYSTYGNAQELLPLYQAALAVIAAKSIAIAIVDEVLEYDSALVTLSNPPSAGTAAAPGSDYVSIYDIRGTFVVTDPTSGANTTYMIDDWAGDIEFRSVHPNETDAGGAYAPVGGPNLHIRLLPNGDGTGLAEAYWNQ